MGGRGPLCAGEDDADLRERRPELAPQLRPGRRKTLPKDRRRALREDAGGEDRPPIAARATGNRAGAHSVIVFMEKVTPKTKVP